jgi:hypothetical protein
MGIRSRLRRNAHERYNSACLPQRELFATSEGGANALANLGTSLAESDRWSTERQRHLDDERAATIRCRTLYRTLRDSLNTVVKVSRFVDLDEATANVIGRLSNTRYDELLTVAAAALDKVTQHSAAFLAQGLPADILKDLPVQIQGLKAALKARADARVLRRAAGESMQSALVASDTAIKQLHVIAVSTRSADPNFVSQLRLAKRVGPAKAKDQPSAAHPPAPVAATGTA